MCCRLYQQNTCAYLRQRQRGCCSSRRNYDYPTLDTNSALQPSGSTGLQPSQPQFSQVQVRGPFSMAAALILGLSLGAQKIQEKREKKKEKKMLMEFTNEQREVKLRNDRASRKREQGERRRSESLEREGGAEEVPPPSYEEAVGEGARGRVR
ncbi:hypothetical protein BU23DRAFT_186350 [Bimuria novae-zelandiae CBS 107.79]|uniref:Uncharacterized protein n=1 Tax=Bimuria novae-zelandiae CBS 107.79 TaxID=1447943 RepID=A0A6A5VQ63_9PLEO|nr:hypothetical protein BU23DRAFT_186350 [Bimuria novae-zelandiae CBS 107.79]